MIYHVIFIIEFERLPVIVTGGKRLLLDTHEIVPDSDRLLAAISCAAFKKNTRFWPKFQNISDFQLSVILSKSHIIESYEIYLSGYELNRNISKYG